MASVGVIGTGWGARVQVPTFREAGFDVLAIAGRDPARTRRVATELEVNPWDDWRALIESSGVDLVTIVTPPSEHREMALAALKAGKHVLCEKPTALDASQAADLVAAAGDHPAQIALIDHELRFVPSFAAARERIHEIGALRYIEVRYSSPSRGDRNRPWNWWSDESRGGGIWGAVGSHFIDDVRFLGFEIDAVRATLTTIIDERPFESGRRPVTSDDFAAVQLRLDGGALAVMTLSAVAASPDEPTVMIIHGEEGSFRLVGEELLASFRGGAFERIAGHDLQKRPGNSAGGPFGTGTLMLGRALRTAIDDDNRDAIALAATFSDGLQQQRVLDAARRSSRDGGAWTTQEKGGP